VIDFSRSGESPLEASREYKGRGDIRNLEVFSFSALGGEGDLSRFSYRLSKHTDAFLMIVPASSGLTWKEMGNESPGPKAP